MKRKSIRVIVFVGVFLSVLVALAIAAQDKYTLRVPNGLAFSEFRGYENWQVVAVSQTEESAEGGGRQSHDDRRLPGRRSRQR